jgi:hypothetical protein
MPRTNVPAGTRTNTPTGTRTNTPSATRTYTPSPTPVEGGGGSIPADITITRGSAIGAGVWAPGASGIGSDGSQFDTGTAAADARIKAGQLFGSVGPVWQFMYGNGPCDPWPSPTGPKYWTTTGPCGASLNGRMGRIRTYSADGGVTKPRMGITVVYVPGWMTTTGTAGVQIQEPPSLTHIGNGNWASLLNSMFDSGLFNDLTDFGIWAEGRGLWTSSRPEAPGQKGWNMTHFFSMWNVFAPIVRTKRPLAKINGPYLEAYRGYTSWGGNDKIGTGISGYAYLRDRNWGSMSQQSMAAIAYFLDNVNTAQVDVLTIEANCIPRGGMTEAGVTTTMLAKYMYKDLMDWIRNYNAVGAAKEVILAEWYPGPTEAPPSTCDTACENQRAAWGAAAMGGQARALITSGLIWYPQAGTGWSDGGYWGNTNLGGPTTVEIKPMYTAAKMVKDYLGPGNTVYESTLSDTADESYIFTVANATQTFVVNIGNDSVTANINGSPFTIPAMSFGMYAA